MFQIRRICGEWWRHIAVHTTHTRHMWMNVSRFACTMRSQKCEIQWYNFVVWPLHTIRISIAVCVCAASKPNAVASAMSNNGIEFISFNFTFWLQLSVDTICRSIFVPYSLSSATAPAYAASQTINAIAIQSIESNATQKKICNFKIGKSHLRTCWSCKINSNINVLLANID